MTRAFVLIAAIAFTIAGWGLIMFMHGHVATQ